MIAPSLWTHAVYAMRQSRIVMFAFMVACTIVDVSLEQALGNSRSTDASSSIRDIGFTLTRPLHTLLVTNPTHVDVLACISSTIIGAIALAGALYSCLYLRRFGIALVMYGVLLLRAALAACTSLPRSPEYLHSDYDWPNPLVGNFIFLFSGHAAILAFYGHWLWCHGSRGSACFVHAFHATQWVYLLATHGHYTADLVLGSLVGWYAVRFEPCATRLCRRAEAFVAKWEANLKSASRSAAVPGSKAPQLRE